MGLCLAWWDCLRVGKGNKTEVSSEALQRRELTLTIGSSFPHFPYLRVFYDKVFEVVMSSYVNLIFTFQSG